MATIIYVERRNKAGDVQRREPCGNYREAWEVLLDMVGSDASPPPPVLADGDSFHVYEVSDAEA